MIFVILFLCFGEFGRGERETDCREGLLAFLYFNAKIMI